MKKVIAVMSLVAVTTMYGAYELFQFVPVAIGTAVIAEKGEDGFGRNATLLPASMTTEQNRLMNEAYVIARADGHKDPEILQSILLQETKAGGMKSYKVVNPGPEAYFGPMQIKLAAARDVLAKHPDLWTKFAFHTRTDDEIKANLILNDEFNLEIASKYLMILKRTYGLSGRELVNAYNRGPGGVKAVDNNFHYAKGAEMKMSAWKNGKK